jgi:hypothetical protein
MFLARVKLFATLRTFIPRKIQPLDQIGRDRFSHAGPSDALAGEVTR